MAEAPRNSMLTSAELSNVISKTVNHVMNESPQLTSETSSSSKRRIKNDNQVRRPMNAFMVYAQVARKKVAGKYPNLSYRKLSKTLGELWRMLDDEERKPFVEEADRLRREHKEAHPTYKFKPQRRRKKAEKQSELVKPAQFAGSSAVTYVSSNPMTEQSRQILQGRNYSRNPVDYNTSGNLLTSTYHSRTDSSTVSTVWPFLSNNSSEPYFDTNSNIIPASNATRGFPNISPITANSSINFPNQRPYFDPIIDHTKMIGPHDSCLGSPTSCSQNSLAINLPAPEQSSDFRRTKFLNASSPSNASCFSESYSAQLSSIENIPYPVSSDTYNLGNRTLPPFSRSLPSSVITSTNLPPQADAMNNPYSRNMFPDLPRPSETRNEPILNFIHHM